MIETRTVFVPGIALNYDGNMLESVGIGGEMFRRETPLRAENTRLRAENAKLRDELKQWERLAEGIELPAYPMTQFQPKDLERENRKLRELASNMYRNMHGVLDCSLDTVWVDSLMTLRDCMDEHMEIMAELGMPPSDYESRRRELGIEVGE